MKHSTNNKSIRVKMDRQKKLTIQRLLLKLQEIDSAAQINPLNPVSFFNLIRSRKFSMDCVERGNGEWIVRLFRGDSDEFFCSIAFLNVPEGEGDRDHFLSFDRKNKTEIQGSTASSNWETEFLDIVEGRLEDAGISLW